MKLLLILNENPPGAHSDIHHSLNELREEGILNDFYVYPFLSRLANGFSDKQVTQEIVKIAEKFQPSAILWSHTGSLFVNDNDMQKIQNVSSNPSMGYWDGDIYQKPQPLNKNIVAICKKSDVTFIQGAGDFWELLKKNNCKDIRYVPGSTDTNRFCKLRSPEKKIIYDVVLIGNNVTSKLPWRTAPGSRWRKKIAEFFYKKLGNRFAVFGNGWKTNYGKGALPFDQQVDLYHKSRVALGVNNWLGAKYYFSNRLPIAMSSGIPVVHNYESGYEEIFKPLEDFYFFNSTLEAWNITEKLLNKDQSELDKTGLKGYHFAKNNLSATSILLYMIDTLKDHWLAKRENEMLKIKTNPWIKLRQL